MIDALSARVNRSDSGIVARIAGAAIGADGFLPNMGTEDFLDCLSRLALERSCKETPVLPRARVRETRAALVEHFATGRFVHPAALFAPDAAEIAKWLSSNTIAANDDEDVDALLEKLTAYFDGKAPLASNELRHVVFTQAKADKAYDAAVVDVYLERAVTVLVAVE